MGEVVVPDNYIPKPGDVLKTVYRGVNKSGVPVNDDDVISSLMNVPNSAVEDEVYKQTGVRIKIRNHIAEVVTPGQEWRYGVEYEVVEAQTPPIAVLAAVLIVTVVSFLVIVYAIDWFVERNSKVEVAGQTIDLRGLITLLLIVALLVWLLKR